MCNHVIAVTDDGQEFAWAALRCSLTGVPFSQWTRPALALGGPRSYASLPAVVKELAQDGESARAAPGEWCSRALLCESGALYTWGACDSSRLGLGEDVDDAEDPMRAL
jgi:hypothetical protein